MRQRSITICDVTKCVRDRILSPSNSGRLDNSSLRVFGLFVSTLDPIAGAVIVVVVFVVVVVVVVVVVAELSSREGPLFARPEPCQ